MFTVPYKTLAIFVFPDKACFESLRPGALSRGLPVGGAARDGAFRYDEFS
jgi:hypothetical protein